MLLDLPVERGGVGVADIRLDFDLPAQEALGELDFEDPAGPGTRLQLRLLESGHQILLHLPHGSISETVDRIPGGHRVAAPVDRELAGAGYRFGGTVERSPRKVRDLVTLYAAAWTEMPNAIQATFAGDPRAVSQITVELRGAPKQIKWSALHTYPGSGEILSTRTTVVLPLSG